MAITLWFTGLPASGKTTLASLSAAYLRERGARCENLDGDVLRAVTGGTAGFSWEDRRRQVLFAAFTAQLLNKNGISAVAAFVSPYLDVRDEARRLVGATFMEIFVDCSVEVCMERDPKGLYARWKAGAISGLTGADDPYERPESPDLVLDTDQETVEESFAKIKAFVEGLDI